jgi:RNA polymerase sigma-70 factor (ECF subfamily)
MMDAVHLNEIEQLRSGDQAVAEIFHRYREPLLRTIRFRIDPRLLGRIDQDDVLQDTYLEVARRVSRFCEDPQVPFFIWVRQITIQILIDLHRTHLGAAKRSAKLEVSLHRPTGAAFSNSYSLAAQLVGNLTSPSQAMVREERIAQLREALDKMDEIDREVLMLRHLEELSNNETAAVLGLEKSAASKRYIRALTRLKEALDPL